MLLEKIKSLNTIFSVSRMFEMATRFFISQLHWHGHYLRPKGQPLHYNCGNGQPGTYLELTHTSCEFCMLIKTYE